MNLGSFRNSADVGFVCAMVSWRRPWSRINVISHFLGKFPCARNWVYTRWHESTHRTTGACQITLMGWDLKTDNRWLATTRGACFPLDQLYEAESESVISTQRIVGAKLATGKNSKLETDPDGCDEKLCIGLSFETEIENSSVMWTSWMTFSPKSPKIQSIVRLCLFRNSPTLFNWGLWLENPAIPVVVFHAVELW